LKITALLLVYVIVLVLVMVLRVPFGLGLEEHCLGLGLTEAEFLGLEDHCLALGLRHCLGVGHGLENTIAVLVLVLKTTTLVLV